MAADPHHKIVMEGSCTDAKRKSDDRCDQCKFGYVKECEHPNTWWHWEEITAAGRDYILFGLLAGIRREGPRKPKGLPTDISDTVEEAFIDYTDCHSANYISLEEFKKVVFEEYNEKADIRFRHEPTDNDNIFYDYNDFRGNYEARPPDYTSIITYGEKLREEHNVEKYILDNDSVNDVDVRLVFWFDN